MNRALIAQTQPPYFTDPNADLALVAEGGGQRGIFTAGVLDSWQNAHFNPFELFIGVSAGAQNLSSFLSQQPGYAFRAITEWTRSKPFYNPWNVLKGQHIMDLDWYFDLINDQRNALDTSTAERQLQNRRLFFAASELTQLDTRLLDPTQTGWVPALKASSAIPMFYRNGVDINGERLVDGGVTAPVPVQQAYQLGARRIVTIRTSTTVNTQFSQWSRPFKQLFCTQGGCPKVLDILDAHECHYQRTLSFLNQPPKDANVITIAPPQPLLSKTLGSTEEALLHHYQMGLRTGSQFINQFAKQFATHINRTMH